MPSLRALATLTALSLALATPAHAGIRTFGWLHDTDTLPERSVELEQWISERAGEVNDWTTIWWGPIIGVTDEIEIALPVEISYLEDGMGNDQTVLDTWGIDLHWRLVTSDKATAPRFVPLLRAGVARLVEDRDAIRGALGLTVTTDVGARVHLVAEAGVVAVSSGPSYELNGGVGAVVALTDDNDLRVGAEVFGRAHLESDDAKPDPWIAAGPTLFWLHGRFWLTVNVLVGLHDTAPDLSPRVVWAVLF